MDLSTADSIVAKLKVKGVTAFSELVKKPPEDAKFVQPADANFMVKAAFFGPSDDQDKARLAIVNAVAEDELKRKPESWELALHQTKHIKPDATKPPGRQ